MGIAIYQSKALFKGYCHPSYNFNFIKGILHNFLKKVQRMNKRRLKRTFICVFTSVYIHHFFPLQSLPTMWMIEPAWIIIAHGSHHAWWTCSPLTLHFIGWTQHYIDDVTPKTIYGKYSRCPKVVFFCNRQLAKFRIVPTLRGIRLYNPLL